MKQERIPSEQPDIDSERASEEAERAEELALANKLQDEHPGWTLSYALTSAEQILSGKRREKRMADKEKIH